VARGEGDARDDFFGDFERWYAPLWDALGRELGVPMRLANLVMEEMTEAVNRGWGERDSRASMLLQEERAGVEIRVPETAIRQVLEGDRG
jgi:hypothetical protein